MKSVWYYHGRQAAKSGEPPKPPKVHGRVPIDVAKDVSKAKRDYIFGYRSYIKG